MSTPKLNPGDRLSFFRNGNLAAISTIDRVTPSGIMVCGSVRVTPKMTVQGAHSFSTSHVEPTTDEHLEMANRARMLDRMKRTDFSKLTDTQLRAILDLILGTNER